MDNEVVSMDAIQKAYIKARQEQIEGVLSDEEYFDRVDELKEQYRSQEFRELMLDNGLPEEQLDSITPEMKRVFLQWIEEMNELQKRVDNYANWAEDCPY